MASLVASAYGIGMSYVRLTAIFVGFAFGAAACSGSATNELSAAAPETSAVEATAAPETTAPETTVAEATAAPETTAVETTAPAPVETREAILQLASLELYGGGTFDPASVAGENVILWFWGAH